MCLTKLVSTLAMCNQEGGCLKRGGPNDEYTEMFKKVSKVYAKSASIVYFKVNFRLAPVKNGVQMVKMVKIWILLKNNC